jgi:hypothetical protein
MCTSTAYLAGAGKVAIVAGLGGGLVIIMRPPARRLADRFHPLRLSGVLLGEPATAGFVDNRAATIVANMIAGIQVVRQRSSVFSDGSTLRAFIEGFAGLFLWF